MLTIDAALGPSTAVSLIDPNEGMCYGDVCPVNSEFYGLDRLVYVGQNFTYLAERGYNNKAQLHKSTPYLSCCKRLHEMGLKMQKKYLPFRLEHDAVGFVGASCLFNKAKAGGGRRPTVVWTPTHVDGVLSDRPISDLVAEFEIAEWHLRRHRRRYRDMQDPGCWFEIDKLAWWTIDDVYLVYPTI